MNSSKRPISLPFVLLLGMFSIAAIVPADARAQDDADGVSAVAYGKSRAFFDHCVALVPSMAPQLREAIARWESRLFSAKRLQALRDGADAERVAKGREAMTSRFAKEEDTSIPVIPIACAILVSEEREAKPPSMSESQIEDEFVAKSMQVALPLALAHLDCATLDAVEISWPDKIGGDIGDVVETWTFRACGRSLDLNMRRVSDDGSVHLRDDVGRLLKTMMPSTQGQGG